MITKKNLLIKATKALKANGNRISFPDNSYCSVYYYETLTKTYFLDMILAPSGRIIIYSRPFNMNNNKEDADYLDTFDIKEIINILKLAEIK